ncbi:MAG TPA: MFS transporter, partial [Flavisolibacter sp.]|nr:MFS transporter [Flavisolibacter sp.]
MDQRKKQRWVIALFFCLAGILTASWSSRIPDVQHKLQLDNAALGVVLFGLPAGLVAGMLLAARFVAHYGVKRIMLLAALAGSVVLVLTSLVNSAVQLMAALFLMGANRTFFNLSINTGAVELQKQYERPILSSFHGIWSLACFVAAAIGTAMIVQNI